MTSEGQHAGQPAEATSGGGGAEPAAGGSAYGAPRSADGFPPEAHEHAREQQQPGAPAAAPQTGWGPDAYPNSYGPPPYPSSGSGSPFVVPAVPVFGAPNGDAQLPAPADAVQAPLSERGPGNSSAVPPEAWAPATPVNNDQGADNPFSRPSEPHPYRATAQAPATPPGTVTFGPAAGQGDPYRNDGDGHPYRSGSSAGGAPQSTPAVDGRFAPGGPLPSRADRPPFGGPGGPASPDDPGGFNGFVSASASPPSDASPAGGTPPAQDPAGDDRVPGISAFGGQRVRVPGAALSNLPDAPPPGRPADISGGFPVRGGPAAVPESGEPARPRQTNNGLPVRGSGTQPGFPAQGGIGFASVRPQDPGAPPARGEESGAFRARGQGSDAFRVRGQHSDAFPAREQDPADRGQARDASGAGAGDPASVVATAHDGAFGTPPGEPPAVPQPRTPTDPPSGQQSTAPAVGTARPVFASASVPVASRVTPPEDIQELPPTVGGTRPRVYGRPPQADGPAVPESESDRLDTNRPESDRSDPGPSGSDRAPFGQPGNGQAGFAQPPFGPRGAESGPPVVRATASARVKPPPPSAPSFPLGSPTGFGVAPDEHGGSPFGEHTSDIAGRGTGIPADQFRRPAGTASGSMFPDDSERPDGDGQGGAPYSEHTTDLAGRGRSTDKPYVPAPALPPMHAAPASVDGFPTAALPADEQPDRRPDRPQLGGVFPGPTTRATVTPPSMAETTSWPGPVEKAAEQARFEAFKPEADARPAEPEKTEPPHVRMLPVLLGVILAAALLVGAAIGIVWLIARPADKGFNVDAGDCVKRSGDNAVIANCADPESFEVVSKVDTQQQCADPSQPYVQNPAGDGRTQIICLKPKK